jgi:hypothetical protein
MPQSKGAKFKLGHYPKQACTLRSPLNGADGFATRNYYNLARSKSIQRFRFGA